MSQSVDIKVDVNEETGLVTGRNGTVIVKGVHVWTGNDRVFIDCLNRKGKVINAGIILDEQAMDKLAVEWIEQRRIELK